MVTAAFFNFHPAMIAAAVPACWGTIDPDQLTVLRAQAASVALSELCPPEALSGLRRALPLLRQAVDHCAGEGRVLTGANRALWPAVAAALGQRGVSGDQLEVAEAWQACTTLREHRGDGHVAALVAHGLSGLEAHLLASGTLGVPAEVLRDNRGWDGAAWTLGAERLAGRGLLDADGAATEHGRARHAEVEALTDRLAEAPYAALTDEETGTLRGAAAGCARAIQSSGLFPFPNPMGLPRL
ncbi:MAG TPA: hypothetical protein VG298_13795 [Acidimicrobiales bacterium]|nr:hypothetical protein [Acidimicrobiales bacterium]